MRRPVIYLSVIGGVLLALFLIYVFRPSVSNRGSLKPSITPTAALSKETMSIVADKEIVNKTDSFTVTIVIDARKPVTGYDSKVMYDSKKLKFLSAKTLNSSFDIYTQNKEGEVIVSGIKSLSVTSPVILENAQVAQLQFQPLIEGQIDLNLAYEQGSKAETNIISDTSEDILEEVKGTTVFVGNSLRLTLNQTVNLDSTTVLTVKELGIPGKECADCMTSMIMEIKKGSSVEKVEFRVGGIAGFMDVNAQAQGYSFHLQDVTEGKAVVIYTKL